MKGICFNCFSPIEESGPCPHCGYGGSFSGEPDGVLPPLTVLNGKYRVGRTLGIGGFGITYVAQDTASGERVAIKEFMPSQLAYRDGMEVCSTSRHTLDAFEHCRDGFLKESAILQNVRNDPSVVRVLEYFTQNNTAYIVMELLEGETLREWTKRQGGRLDIRSATEMLLVIGSALMAVHERHILHRDISPENIFRTQNGEYKLIDFGASRYVVSEKSQSLSVYLKPGYAPPEQYSSKGNQGPWTDIYGLAATYYTVLSGKGMIDTMDRLSGVPYLPLKDCVPDFPAANSRVIDRALALNYRERYQDVSSFLDALDLSGIVNSSHPGGEGVTCHSSPEPPAERQRKRGIFGRKKKEKRKKASVPPVPAAASNGMAVETYSGSLLLQRLPIVPGNYMLTLGRAAGCDMVMADSDQISRFHCQLYISSVAGGTKFWIQDQSANGTYIDGQRLPFKRAVEIGIGTPVYLADHSHYFIIVQSGTA